MLPPARAQITKREVATLEAIVSAFQNARLRCSAATTKARSLEQLIGIKEAELYALEELLRLQPHDACALEVMRPDLWVERLAQLVLLSDYAGQLPESFAALIRDAVVPHHRPRTKTSLILDNPAHTPCSRNRGLSARTWHYCHPLAPFRGATGQGGVYFVSQHGSMTCPRGLIS